MSITIRIDVRLSDQAVLSFIKQQSVDGVSRVTLLEISEAIGCNVITAHRIIKRLQVAGFITRLKGGSRRGGNAYRVNP